MKATVIEQFKGVRDGEIYPVVFKPGDTIVGECAQVAVEEGWAKPVKGSESAPTQVQEHAAGEQGETSDPDKTQPKETAPAKGNGKSRKKR